jgi:dTDP-glucose 4,6-dehydratase
MNIFGERQHPEKFIPLCIKNSKLGKKLFIHANKALTEAGSRYYIHAKNVCSAVDFLLKNGTSGEKYNIVGEKEVDNLTLAKIISSCVGNELNYELVDFHGSRPGHDLRYALDGIKMANLGWTPINNLEQSLSDVVQWSLKNPKWIGL